MTFLGWLSDPLKWLSDLQRLGMKRSRIESPGIWSLLWLSLYYIPGFFKTLSNFPPESTLRHVSAFATILEVSRWFPVGLNRGLLEGKRGGYAETWGKPGSFSEESWWLVPGQMTSFFKDGKWKIKEKVKKLWCECVMGVMVFFGFPIPSLVYLPIVGPKILA